VERAKNQTCGDLKLYRVKCRKSPLIGLFRAKYSFLCCSHDRHDVESDMTFELIWNQTCLWTVFTFKLSNACKISKQKTTERTIELGYTWTMINCA